jgi:hypothetical protein
MLERRDPDPRDDIYALACITYELLTGHHPFNRLSSAQARGAAMKPPRPASLGRGQWQALKCALSLEREQRTPTVVRFLADFGAGGARPRYRLVAASGAAIVAVGALAVAGWHYLERTPAAEAEAGAAAPATAAAVPDAVLPATPAATPAPAPAAAPPSAAAVAETLARIPCSALSAQMQGSRVAVQGVVSHALGALGVQRSLMAMSGVDRVEADVREVDPASCAVVSTYAPYWLAHRQAGGGVSLRLAGAAGGAAAGLAEGDSLMVDVTTPAADSYMAVDAFSPDASVIHLLPNALDLDNRAPPHHRATIGRPGDWRIGKPAGSGLLVVLVTTPAPLFRTLRRESEPSADYQDSVAKSLEQIRAANAPGRIGVEFLPVATRAPAR